MPDAAKIRVAILSQDAALSALVSDAVTRAGDRFEAVPGTDARAVESSDGAPDALLLILLIDLASDPVARLQVVRQQAERLPGVPILAVGPALSPEMLIEGMRAGITEYVQRPVAAEELAAALLRVGRRFGVAGGAKRTGQIFAFLPAKGGAGATSAAVNFAVELRRATGEDTLLADLDLELGGVALWLGLRPRFSFLDLVRNFHRLDAGLLSSYVEHHDSGVRVLPAPPGAERSDAISAEEASRVFAFLKGVHRYVVLDLPKALTPLTLAALHDADVCVAVTTPDLPSLGSLKRLLPILARLGERSADRLWVVLNRHSSGGAVTVDDVRTVLEMDVRWTLSNDYETVSRAANEGKPAVLDRRSAYARDMAKIVAQVANGNGHGKARPPERPRMSDALRHLFKRGTED
jgi:pilus assembly protein CpaE